MKVSIDSEARQGCIMSLWLFNVYMDRYEVEEDLRVMMGRLAEVCKRRELKINAGKSKVMVLN